MQLIVFVFQEPEISPAARSIQKWSRKLTQIKADALVTRLEVEANDRRIAELHEMHAAALEKIAEKRARRNMWTRLHGASDTLYINTPTPCNLFI